MEQIGLEGIFDLEKFDKGLAGYLKGLDKADGATQSMGGKFGKAFDDMGAGVLKVAGLLSGALAAGAVAAGAAIVGFAVSGINKASDLESKMGGIASIMGETKAAIEPLKELILDLGMDPNLKVDATEAADAIEKLASNGLTMTQIMDGAAKSTVLLANSTGADFDTAAAVATDSMALFNIEAANMQEAVNGITGVTVASKFDINDYRLALSQAGGVAAATGVEFDDFNASISGISNYFASGSDAGTSFKTMLLRLNPQTDEAADAMKALGLNFFDANGNMKSMAEVSTELNDAFAKEITFTNTVSNLTDEQAARKKKLEQTIKSLTGKLADYQSGIAGVAQSENEKVVAVDRLNRQLVAAQAEYAGLASIQGTTTSTTRKLTEEEKTHYLSVIFGTDAMRAAVAMSEQGEIAYTDLNVAAKELGVGIDELTQYADGGITKFEAMLVTIGKTDAVESAKVRMDNFKGSMEILQGVIDTVALKIGFTFLPMLKNMADNLSNFISNHADQIVMFFENFAGAVDAFVSGAPGDFPWEDIFPPWLAATMYVISELVEGISIALADFNSGAMGLDYPWEDIFPAWLANTIYFVTENVDAFTGALGGIAALLASAGIAAAISGIAAALAGLLSPIVLIVAGAAALGAAWNSNFLGMKDATFAVIDALSKAFMPLTIAIHDFGSGALGEIVNFVMGNQTEFDNLEALWTGVSAAARILFADIISAVTTNLPLWIAKMLEWAAVMVNWVSVAAANVGAKISEWATSAISALATNLPTWIAKMLEWGATLINWIGLAESGTITKIGEWATALVTWLSGEGKTQVGESTGGLVSALIDWIVNDLIPKVGPAMLNFGLALGGAVLNVATALGIAALSIGGAIWAAIMATDWSGVGTNILTLIKDGWEATKATILPILGGVATGLLEKFTSVNWNQLGTDILTFIKDGYETAKATVLPVIGAVATSVKEKFTEIDWKTLGTNALTYVKDGFETTKTTVLPLIGAVATSLETKFSEIDWKKLGTDALTLIKDGWEFAKTTVLPIIGTIAESLKTKFNETDWKTLGTDTANAIRDGLKAAADLADGLIAGALTIATGVKDAFTTQSWGELGTTISNDIKTSLDTAANAADGLIAQMGTIATDLGNKLIETDWKEVGKGISVFIKDGLKAAADALDGLLATAGTIVTDLIAKFTGGDWSGTGTGIMDALRDAVETAAYAAAGLIYIVGQIALGIVEEFTGIDFAATATTMMNALRDGIKTAVDAAGGLLEQVATTATDIITKFTDINWSDDIGKYLADKIRDGITSAADAAGGLYEIVAGIPTAIKKIFTDLLETWKGIGSDIVGGIGAGITGAKDALMEKAQALADSLPGWVKEILGISSPSKVFMEIGRNVVQGLIVGIQDQLPPLEHAVVQMSQKLSAFELMDVSFGATSDFADRLSETYLKPLSDTVDQVRRREQQFRDTIAQIQYDISLPSTSLPRRLELQSWLAAVQQEYAKFQSDTANLRYPERLNIMQEVMRTGDWARGEVDFLEDQIALMKEAKAIGIDVSSVKIGDTGSDNVVRMAAIEKEIALAKRQQLLLTAKQVQEQTKLSNQYQVSIDAINHVETYNSHLSDQLAMMKKAEGLGLDLGQMWSGGIIRDPNDVEKLLSLQLRIASATGASMENQMNTMITEQKRVKGLAAAMQQLQPLVDQTNVSSAFGQKYKAEVLDPMLRALEKSAGIDSERLRLMNEYTAAAQKLIEINKKEGQLDFLKQQLDVIKMIKDQDLVGGNSLFDGIAFGVNASIDDLLTLTNRVLNAMITEVKDELGIHSPSQVFADIGGQMMAGLQQGIQKGFMQPLNALRQGAVAHGSMSTRTLNFAMGGVTINTPMDEVMFESRVLRILERSMN